MYPTILNMVVEALVHHWIFLVVEVAGGQCGWGREVLHCAASFYSYDGLVASMYPVWFQGAFEILTRLFNMVGIQENVGNMVGMLWRPCRAVGTHLEADYKRRMTGEGINYRA